MNYYYHSNEENKGPVSLEDLSRLHDEGAINMSTPIIEKGGKEWRRYRDVYNNRGVKTGEERSSHNEVGFIKKIGDFNLKVDGFFEKIFNIPVLASGDRDSQIRVVQKLGSWQNLILWGGVVLLSMMIGFSETARALGVPSLLVLIVGCILGFVLQYLCFQMYSMSTSLLFGKRIILSSESFPKILGMVSIVLSLVALIFIFLASGGTAVCLSISFCLVFSMMACLCIHSRKIIVRTSPETVSPGREITNILRFIIRVFCTTIHVLSPALIVLAYISIICMLNDARDLKSILSLELMLKNMTGSLLIIVVPIINFFVLCLFSWLLDLFDSIFAAGSRETI